MKTILSLLVLLVGSVSFARLSDGKAHLKLQGDEIVVSVDKGFHFNKDAPAAVVIGEQSTEPRIKEEKKFVYSAKAAKKAAQFAVTFYICDDGNTVCEEHKYSYQIKGKKLILAKDAKVAAAKAATGPADALQKNHHGFYEGDFSEILKMAMEQKKNLFVDFGAPWCPACVRFETEVFGEKDFQKVSEKFIKASVNIDKASNKVWAEKYGIKVIPTLIVMNGEGEELARMIDFRPTAQIVQELKTLQSKPMLAKDDLEKNAAEGDDSARQELALRAFNSMNFAEAVKWLSPMGIKTFLLAKSEIGVAQKRYGEDEKENKEVLKKALEKWIAVYPDSLDSIFWREELVKLYKGETTDVSSEMKELTNKNIALIQKLLSGTEKDLKEAASKSLSGNMADDLERVILYSSLKSSFESLSDADSATETKEAEKKELAKISFNVKYPGQILAALEYFAETDQKAQISSWLEKLVKTYPQSDVYVGRLARHYVDEKQFEKALPLAEKAAKLATDLKLSRLERVAKIHKELKQTKQARAVLEQALALPEAQAEHAKKQKASLEELLKSLEG